MTTDPDVHDLKPDMGTTRASLEKGAIVVIWLISGFFLGIFFFGVLRVQPSPVLSFVIFCFHILITYWIWRVLRRYRVRQFKKRRGDYEPAILAQKEAEAQARKAASQAWKNAAETTGKLASGAIGLIRDAGETVAEKLEERATQVKDSSPVAKGSEQSDIAGRLEKLSNLHEQGGLARL